MMMACGSCGKPALWFSKELWALLCASTVPAASIGLVALQPAFDRGELGCTNGRRRLDRSPGRPLLALRIRRASALASIGARRRMATFEGERRLVIERRMPPRRVVPALDKVKYRRPRLGGRPQRHPIEQLALECREKALAHGVVVAIP